jgi:hypothetical protein
MAEPSCDVYSKGTRRRSVEVTDAQQVGMDVNEDG